MSYIYVCVYVYLSVCLCVCVIFAHHHDNTFIIEIYITTNLISFFYYRKIKHWSSINIWAGNQ